MTIALLLWYVGVKRERDRLMHKSENISTSIFMAFVGLCVFFSCSGAQAQDVVETATQVFRGRVKAADTNSITIEMTVQGRPQEITIPRQMVRRMKVEPPPSVVEGIKAYEEGDWRKAKLNLERVILNYQGLDMEWAQKGMVYFGRASIFGGDDKNAEQAFSLFLSAYPDHGLVIEARLGLANVERARKNHDAALEMFRSLSEPFGEQLRPERQDLSYAAEAYLGIGKCLEAQGDLRAAYDAYVKIMALYPAEGFYPEALFRCAVISSELNELDKAGRYLAELIDEYPATEFARSGLQLRNSIERKKREERI